MDNNLGYLVYGEKTAMAIDGGAAKEILAFVEASGLKLEFVTNTHSHMDHLVGNEALLEGSDAVFLSNEDLLKNRSVKLEEEIRVHHTPGHTGDSVTFCFGNFLSVLEFS